MHEGSETKSAFEACAFSYYGDEHYWMRFNFPMRLIVIAFSFLYVVQSKLLGLLLQATRALEPLEKLNLVIQMKKKIRQYKKARIYFEMLTEPVPEI